MVFYTSCGQLLEIVDNTIVEKETEMEISRERVCSNCGAKIDEGLAFCTECGKKQE